MTESLKDYYVLGWSSERQPLVTTLSLYFEIYEDAKFAVEALSRCIRFKDVNLCIVKESWYIVPPYV